MVEAKRPKAPQHPVSIARSYFPEEDIARFLDEAPGILRGRVSMGHWVNEFQMAALTAHQTRFAFATNSCTAALEMAMLASGVTPGAEVLVPVQTFIATGMAVYNIGAKPVFCDIRRKTLCLDPDELERRGSDRVKAVILVHFGGLITPDLPRIVEICRNRGWVLIEDAAHAHGAAFAGRAAGSLGDAGCFSYYPTKILTTGEGGMVVTNDQKIAKICASYQSRGQNLEVPGEVFARPYGRNLRLPELSALLGVLQYGRLKEFVDKRRAVAAIYERELAQESTIEVPRSGPESFHSYWLYPIILPSNVDRTILKKNCCDNWNITIDWSYFPPLHLMPVFESLYGSAIGDAPVAEDILGRLVCLPVNPTITEADAVAAVRCFLHEYHCLQANSALS